MVKNSPANAGDIRDVGLIAGSGRSPGGRHGNNWLQYSCLENPTDREAIGSKQAIVHRVANSRTQLKQLCMHAYTHTEVSPSFQKFTLYHFTFNEKPALVPLFVNQKKSEDVCFYEKKVTRENSFQHLFCKGLLERHHAPQALPRTFPRHSTSISASSHHSSELCLWALCFTFIP